MSYESPEERIERLENQVSALLRAITLIADNARQNQKGFLQMIALLADQTKRLVDVDLVNLKTVFEQSKGFDEPFRQAMLKTIAGLQQQNTTSPSVVDVLNKLSWPILPEDLFGPGHQWPPQNPPGNQPGA